VNDFIKGCRKGMHAFGQAITVIVNSVLLTIVYLAGVGLAAIMVRLAGKRFLELKPDKKAGTYWADLDLKKRPIEEHYRQF
jgi:hypothetical protein